MIEIHESDLKEILFIHHPYNAITNQLDTTKSQCACGYLTSKPSEWSQHLIDQIKKYLDSELE